MSYNDRFKDAAWYREDNNVPVTIIGAGGIGSWLAFSLARAGFPSFIYDNDVIESHNLGGQLFSESQIGMLKTDAVQNTVKTFSGVDINTIAEKFTEDSKVSSFVFSAVDNMEARKNIFEAWLKLPHSELPVAPLFVDGRLEMEQIQVFTITNNPEQIEYYRSTLFDDSEVEDLPCTLKQTSHVAMMCASIMTCAFTNHIANINIKANDYEVPNKVEIYVPNFYMKDEFVS